MNVLLISANTEKINMPTLPMGLACMAAAIEAAGHEIRFLDLMGEQDAASATADYRLTSPIGCFTLSQNKISSPPLISFFFAAAIHLPGSAILS